MTIPFRLWVYTAIAMAIGWALAGFLAGVLYHAH